MTGGPRKAGCRWILSQVLSMVIMDVDNHDVIWFEVLFPWTKNQVRWHDLPVETIGFWPFYFIWAAATGGAFSFPMNKESSEMAWSSCWNHRILALLLHLSSLLRWRRRARILWFQQEDHAMQPQEEHFPMNKESSEMAWSSWRNHRILALLLHLSSSHRRSIWSEHAGIGFMIYVFHEILESCEWLAWQFACTQFMDFRILGLSWMTNRRSLTSYPRGFCGEMWRVWRSFDAFDV